MLGDLRWTARGSWPRSAATAGLIWQLEDQDLGERGGRRQGREGGEGGEERRGKGRRREAHGGGQLSLATRDVEDSGADGNLAEPERRDLRPSAIITVCTPPTHLYM